MTAAERTSSDKRRALRDIVRRQHRVVTAAQARIAGFSDSAISRLVRAGEWQRLLAGVYFTGSDAPQLEQLAHAAVLWAGDESVLSHTTAARVWQLDQVPVGGIELWVPPARHVRSEAVTVHRGPVARNDRRVRDDFPITSAARTVVDCAPRLDDERLEAMLEEVFRRGLSTADGVRRCLERSGGKGRAGAGRLRSLLDDRGSAPALESPLEVRIWRLVRGAGLRPLRQHVVACGERRFRLDFAWPALRVAIEGDGYAVHGAHRAFEHDQLRRALLAAHGWLVVPVTWRQVTDDPAGVLRRVHEAVRAAAA